MALPRVLCRARFWLNNDLSAFPKYSSLINNVSFNKCVQIQVVRPFRTNFSVNLVTNEKHDKDKNKDLPSSSSSSSSSDSDDQTDDDSDSDEGQPDATTANAPPPAAAAASGIQIQQDNMQQAPISVMTTPNGAANVIPTSPRYGVAISVALATEPTVTPAIVSSINKIEEDGSSSRTTTDRFKVVKIASLEPFKRGRWKCMDYVDEAPPPNVSKASTQTNNIQGAVYMQSQSLPQQQIHQMLLQGTQFYPNISQLIPQGQYFYPANPQQQPMPNNNNNNQFINTQPYFVAANMNPSTGFTLPQNYPNIQYVPIPAQNSAFVSTTQHFQQSQTYAGQATQPVLMNGHHITYPQQNEPQILPSQPAKSVTSNNNPSIQHQPFQPPQPQTYQQPAPAAQNIIQPQNVDSSATNNGPPNPQLATLTALDDETGSSAINVEDPSTKSNPVNAIDNKIEQAMDLVKSHLMYTVREEVEVLKEKIAELMERIQQLETENNYLKSQIPKNAMAPPGSSNNAAFQQQPNIAIVNPSPSFVTQQTINDYSTTNDHQSDKDSVQVQ